MKRLSLCLIVLLLAATPCLGQKNIVETAVGAGNFTTLVAAVKAAGLADTLMGGEFTVLAPTDEAFAKLDQGPVESLLKPENRDQLTAILTYHVIPGRVSARAAFPLAFATTVNGQRLKLDLQSNPPAIGNARILKTDIDCSNGVIHVIDSVLLPASQTIPEVAGEAGQFKTLLAAATEAGLAEALSGAGPFTVFAPTDEAFSNLPEGTVESLLKPENRDQLADILKYHVIPARVYSIGAVEAGSASTLLGRSVTINFSEQGLRVNQANIVGRDIDASNGVIHIIDSVLLPSKGLNPAATIGLIQDAVHRGATVYNNGHHQQCCQIYMTTLEKIRDEGIAGGDTHTMKLIDETLSRAADMHDSTNRAWVLRSCIDTVFTRMSKMPTSVR